MDRVKTWLFSWSCNDSIKDRLQDLQEEDDNDIDSDEKSSLAKH